MDVGNQIRFYRKEKQLSQMALGEVAERMIGAPQGEIPEVEPLLKVRRQHDAQKK